MTSTLSLASYRTENAAKSRLWNRRGVNLSKEFMTKKDFNNICSWDKSYSHVLFNVLVFPLNKKEKFISIPFRLWYHTDHSIGTGIPPVRKQIKYIFISNESSEFSLAFFLFFYYFNTHIFNIYTSVLKKEVAPSQTSQLTLKPTYRHNPPQELLKHSPLPAFLQLKSLCYMFLSLFKS